ncbi:tandem-95 repeat protein, partial [Candidatus Woesearchaeota archaeon]|nr:tandem-95 repeat protein [Candidatus Woesearchaeota archaeon]
MPSGAAFDSSTQTFSWTPDYSQSGSYQVTFSATDGTIADSETITITVNNINRAPVLSSIGNKQTNENELLEFSISAADPDNDALTYTISNLPSGAAFNQQTFSWMPDFTQSGLYQVTFTISDSSLTVSETITITVNNINRAPSLQDLADISINENNIVTITAIASDLDNDALIYSINDTRFAQNNNVFTWQTDFDSARTYISVVTVTDGFLTDSKTVNIIVNNVNRIPVITSAPLTTASEGIEYSYTVMAVDPESDPLTYSLITSPTGMIIDDATIIWTPDFTQSGNYNVTVQVSDGSLAAIQSYTLSVSNTNRDPVLSSIGANLPSGAAFDSSTQTFSWTPDYSQSGSYQVTFSATDGTIADSETISIAVGNSNRAPVITSAPQLNATEGEEYVYQIIATDLDNDTLSYSLIKSPSNMTINSSTGLIIWTPTFDEARIKTNNVTIKVYDGIDYTIQSFDILMGHLLHKSHKFSLDITPATDAQSFSQGEDYISYIRLSNKGQLPEEDIEVSVSIPELNINFIAEQNIYLGPHDIKYAEINFNIPESALPGEYLIRINVGNNDYK